tara:strand:+ start:3326 stop:3805 length:480 start_codon:yes stop_codon:yes gene_type:complete
LSVWRAFFHLRQAEDPRPDGRQFPSAIQAYLVDLHLDFAPGRSIVPADALSASQGRRRRRQPLNVFGTVEETMKKAIILMIVGLSAASCTQTEQGAAIGAGTGAVIGGIATGDVRGAAVGAAIGGVSGALIGSVAQQPGQCYYRDRYGRRYIDDCPRGY